MHRLAQTVVVAALVAGLGASSALANSPARNLADSLPIARAAWPDSPCSGRENVQITSSMSWLNTTAEAEVDGSCVVRIRPIHNPYRFCVTLVHEFGHLTETLDEQGHLHLPDGRPVDEHGHTHDGSIMDDGGGFWDPCEKLGFPVTPREAAADIFDIPSSACRLTAITSRPRGHVYRCGRTRRVLVVLTADGDVDYVTDPSRPEPKRRRH